MIGELLTYVVPQGAETCNLQLDFSQWRLIRKLGQTLTAVLNVWVYDSLGNISTDLVATGAVVGASQQYGTPNSAVNFTLRNANAGLLAGSPVPTSYLVVVQVQFSGGDVRIVGLNVQVEAPPGTEKAGCS